MTTKRTIRSSEIYTFLHFKCRFYNKIKQKYYKYILTYTNMSTSAEALCDYIEGNEEPIRLSIVVDLFGYANWTSFMKSNRGDVLTLFIEVYKGLHMRGVTSKEIHRCFLQNKLDDLIYIKYSVTGSGYYNVFCGKSVKYSKEFERQMIGKPIKIGNTFFDLRADDTCQTINEIVLLIYTIQPSFVHINNSLTDIDELISNKIMAGNPRSNNWPIPTSTSNWLMFSSAFFLIPGAYGAFNGLCVYGVVSTITTLISMAHWWDAQEFSRRRAVDLVVSKVSFGIYFVTGCFFIRDAIVWAIGIPGCMAIIYCFYMSGKAWEADSDYWYIYHMLFHFTVACEQALVLYATILSNGQKCMPF